MSSYLNEPDEILHATEDQMVNAFILFLTRRKKVEEVSRRYQRVRRRKETIEARIEYMTERLESKLLAGNGSVSFAELLPEEPDRYDVTLSFMSLLSMIKNQGYDAEQKENFGEIIVKRKEETAGEEQADV
jgi:segregation and condensation protein A